MQHYPIVVYPRRDSQIDLQALPANVTIVDTPLLDISSTMIRQRVLHGQPIEGLVPKVIEPLVRKYYSVAP